MDVDEDIKTLVSFRAGRMQLADKRLCADPRKGIFRVMNVSILSMAATVCSDCVVTVTLVALCHQLPQIEGLVHMQWIERNEDGSPVDKPEVDQVVFDGECK